MPARRTGAGRRGALEEARELVALVASLSEAGDALTVNAVAAKLGTSRERAEKLIELVLTATLGDETRLPLVEEQGGVTLLLSAGVRGRRLRLSRSETVALAAALEELGVAEDDPLREKLESSLSQEPVDPDLVRSVVAADMTDGTSELAVCAAARAQGRMLAFSYRKAGEDAEEERRAVPLDLRREDGAWYLDAHDPDRGDTRTFRLDRMAHARLLGRADAPQEAAHETARMVEITFSDPRYLQLLPWHRLHVKQTDRRGRVHAETPYYGGDWLPRMLAACAGSASTTDEEVRRRVAAYARSCLGEGPTKVPTEKPATS